MENKPDIFQCSHGSRRMWRSHSLSLLFDDFEPFAPELSTFPKQAWPYTPQDIIA